MLHVLRKRIKTVDNNLEFWQTPCAVFISTVDSCELMWLLDYCPLSGQVYRLRTPSAKYLASLSFYDSSNPTKEWGFPEFFPLSYSIQKGESELGDGVIESKDISTLPDQLAAFGKVVFCC